MPVNERGLDIGVFVKGGVKWDGQKNGVSAIS
jgi:hypothetical protein